MPSPYRGGTVNDRIARAVIDTGHDPWQAEAACQDSPGLMDHTTAPEVFAALQLCLDCPVAKQCSSWAASEPDYAGVAGGLVYSGKRRRGRSSLPKAG